MKRFGERAWNNPVVRIIDVAASSASLADKKYSAAKQLIPRIANDWTLPRLTKSIAEVLEVRKQEIPGYLRLLLQEEVPQRKVETAVYGMT